MKNRVFFVFLASLSLVVSHSVVADAVVARAYDIKDVAEVVVTGGGQLKLTQGDTESLRVEASADVIDKVSVDLSGHKLRLSVKNNVGRGFNIFNWFQSGDSGYPVTYVLQVKNLQMLDLSGGTRSKVGDLTVKNFELHCSGAAVVDFSHVNFNDFFVEQSGASQLHIPVMTGTNVKFQLSGASNTDIEQPSSTKFLVVGASGASNFRAKPLVTSQTEADASGASTITVQVTDFLKAGASGASNIYYSGKAKVQSQSSGASHINSIN